MRPVSRRAVIGGVAMLAAVTAIRHARAGGVWACVTDQCGYLYDPERGDPDQDAPPGTNFEALPDDWRCPVCGVEPETFVPYSTL